MGTPQVEIRRSSRRTRTVALFREQGRLVALVPSRITAAQAEQVLPDLVARFLRREARAGSRLGDAELVDRAGRLYAAHLAPHTGAPLPACSIRWVDNQRSRWGSCSWASGEIRLSSRLRTMPGWVVDSVILHELVHLFHHGHTAEFHELLGHYPQLAEADAFLRGFTHAVAVGAGGDVPSVGDDAGDCLP